MFDAIPEIVPASWAVVRVPSASTARCWFLRKQKNDIGFRYGYIDDDPYEEMLTWYSLQDQFAESLETSPEEALAVLRGVLLLISQGK